MIELEPIWLHTHTHTHTHTHLKAIRGKQGKTPHCKTPVPQKSQKQTDRLRATPQEALDCKTASVYPNGKLEPHSRTIGASTHMLAAPLRRTTQRGTAHAATRTGQTPAIIGRGDEIAGADQSADDPEPEPSREKKTTMCREPTENN